jgi:hypothetical protein
MTDHELLEFAAKAAGIDVEASVLWGSHLTDAPGKRWNPMLDDGDALRLAVALKLKVDVDASYTETTWHPRDPLDPPPCFSSCRHDNDPCAATRRAIVAVAAEVGQRVDRRQSALQLDDDNWMTGGPS